MVKRDCYNCEYAVKVKNGKKIMYGDCGKQCWYPVNEYWKRRKAKKGVK